MQTQESKSTFIYSDGGLSRADFAQFAGFAIYVKPAIFKDVCSMPLPGCLAARDSEMRKRFWLLDAVVVRP